MSFGTIIPVLGAVFIFVFEHHIKVDKWLRHYSENTVLVCFMMGSINADILGKDKKCEHTRLKLLGYLSTVVKSCNRKSYTIENQEGYANITFPSSNRQYLPLDDHGITRISDVSIPDGLPQFSKIITICRFVTMAVICIGKGKKYVLLMV